MELTDQHNVIGSWCLREDGVWLCHVFQNMVPAVEAEQVASFLQVSQTTNRSTINHCNCFRHHTNIDLPTTTTNSSKLYLVTAGDTWYPYLLLLLFCGLLVWCVLIPHGLPVSQCHRPCLDMTMWANVEPLKECLPIIHGTDLDHLSWQSR